jgi:tight adherence protein B
MKKQKRKKEIYEKYCFSAREWVLYLAEGLAAGCFVAWLCYRSLRALPLAALIAAIFIRQKKAGLLRERKQKLHYHFKDFLSSLNTSLRAGYSIENGVRSARKELEKLYGEKDVMAVELAGIVRQMELQVPVEKLFLELGSRSGIEDIQSFGEILRTARRTGGNLGKILQDTWRTLCGKIDTRQEIDTLIAARRYELSLMSLMPAGIILYLRFSFSGFVEKLYGNPAGAAVMTVCLAVYAGAYCLGRRMVRIEV